MSREALDELKQQIPLLDYLQAHDWRPARTLSRGRFMRLCPLHEDHKPSFLVDPLKNLFYCGLKSICRLPRASCPAENRRRCL
jgi:DNA primase